MGIQQRNRDEQIIAFRIPGNQAAGTYKNWDFAEFDGVIANIYAEVRTAGVTGSMVVDVNKNGTTVFSDGTKITFTSAASVNAYSAVADATRQVAKGDKISVDVDSVHTTPAVDLTVYVVLTRRNLGDLRNQSPVAWAA